MNSSSLFHSRVYFSNIDREMIELDSGPCFDIITPEEIEAHKNDAYHSEYIQYADMIYNKLKVFLSFARNSSYYFYPKNSIRYEYRNKNASKYPNLNISSIIVDKKDQSDTITISKQKYANKEQAYIADWMYKLIRFFNQRNDMGIRIIWRKVEKQVDDTFDLTHLFYYELVMVSKNKKDSEVKCTRIKSREYYGRKNEKSDKDPFVIENGYLLRCLMQFMLRYMV